MTPTGLVLDPAIHQTPLDMQAAIEKAVNAQVPLDKHVAVVAVATTAGPRFAVAARINGHMSLVGDLSFTHGSTGQPWSGEVGIEGTW